MNSPPTGATAALAGDPDAVAPDGLDVRVLVACTGGSMAHFELAAGHVSVAVAHRTVEEIWYFVSGRGEMWRRSEETGDETVVEVQSGTAVTIPVRTRFQLRSTGVEPLAAVGTTMPPWPGIGGLDGTGEVDRVDGRWEPTVDSGMGSP